MMLSQFIQLVVAVPQSPTGQKMCSKTSQFDKRKGALVEEGRGQCENSSPIHSLPQASEKGQLCVQETPCHHWPCISDTQCSLVVSHWRGWCLNLSGSILSLPDNTPADVMHRFCAQCEADEAAKMCGFTWRGLGCWLPNVWLCLLLWITMQALITVAPQPGTTCVFLYI